MSAGFVNRRVGRDVNDFNKLSASEFAGAAGRRIIRIASDPDRVHSKVGGKGQQ